jgi:hypothetical protein
MKFLLLGAIVVIGLALAFGGGGSSSNAQNESRSLPQQGVDNVDAYLQKGLTPETHQLIAEKASSSAGWLKGIEETLQRKAEETSQ